jgi:hypothetical protein
VVSTKTGAHPDALALQPWTISVSPKKLYNGPVAILIDANPTTSASRFIATITWGDGAATTGSVVGSGGYFVVTGSHAYRLRGTFATKVTVSALVPDGASASGSGIANVVASTPGRARARTRQPPARNARKPK